MLLEVPAEFEWQKNSGCVRENCFCFLNNFFAILKKKDTPYNKLQDSLQSRSYLFMLLRISDCWAAQLRASDVNTCSLCDPAAQKYWHAKVDDPFSAWVHVKFASCQMQPEKERIPTGGEGLLPMQEMKERERKAKQKQGARSFFARLKSEIGGGGW